MAQRTYVVPLVFQRPRCVEHVGVDKVVVYREVGVPHLGLPELRRKHPSARAISTAPGVADLLVPPAREGVATVIMVTQNTQPLLAIQTLA